MKYNFKSVALFATAILTIGAFSACSNEIENIDEPQKETKTITFTATLGEDDPLSRTSYEEVAVTDGIELKTKWKADDVLYVGLANLNNTGSTIKPGDTGSGYVKATISNLENENRTATFTITPDESWQDGAELNVFYGNTNRTSIYNDKSNVSFNINNLENRPSGSIDNLNNHLSLFDYMTATTVYNKTANTFSDFTLKHEMAVIKFPLKGLDSGDEIKYFEIKSADNSLVFSITAYLNNAEPRFEVAEPARASYAISDQYTTIKENNGTWNVYIVVPPTTATEGKNLIITVKNAKTQKDTPYTGDIYIGNIYGFSALEAGKVYVTPEITMTKQEAAQ